MTRKELNTELHKIDIFIEVLREFIEKPLCGCIVQMNVFNEKFQSENMKQLNALKEMKNYLKTFIYQKDDVLENIIYQPVEIYR